MDKKYVITITRECGSRGDAIARIIAEKLNISLYNSFLVSQAKSKYEIDKIIATKDEISALRKKNNSILRKIIFPGYDGEAAVKDLHFSEKEQIMKLIAENESCIFLGLYSDFVFHESPYAIHIHIYAPYQKRAENYMQDYGVDIQESEMMIQAADEAMAYGYEYYTGSRYDNKNHKGIMIDSSILGTEATADLLIAFINKKLNQEATSDSPDLKEAK